MRRLHHMPFGAEPRTSGGVRFRLWAPAARRVDLCLARPAAREHLLSMQALGDGWFQRVCAQAAAGVRYRYRIDGGPRVPDPASRRNPRDVHGPSEVVDPRAYRWQDRGWCGRPWHEAVIYELHVGAFSRAGTFDGVRARLPYLVDLGVTAIELMPVADFPGARNWGYDGVLPFAPDSRYGHPDRLKSLVDAAHAHGLMVLLDVVYNHFGPEGNYLHTYAPGFFTERHHTPWGAAFDFETQPQVRGFFVHNALYWLEEFHLDGLRLDAVHTIVDDSRPDILEDIAAAVRAGPGRVRHVHLVLENDRNEARRLARDRHGRTSRYTAQWNDDAHHALHVLLTGERDGYYVDYAHHPIVHLGRCLAEGFSYQGERSRHRDGVARGEPSADLPVSAFVPFLQNHDQVGNRAFGERIHALASPEALRAALAVLLLSPAPPLLFMGEEYAAPQPFLFFCDFEPLLAEAVRRGRRREFARFERFRSSAARARIPDPCEPDTFRRSRLHAAQARQAPYREWLVVYRALLHLRREVIVPLVPGLRPGAARFKTVGAHGLHVCWPRRRGGPLVLLANLGGRAQRGFFVPPGRVLHVQGGAADGVHAADAVTLAAWQVCWLLARGGRG